MGAPLSVGTHLWVPVDGATVVGGLWLWLPVIVGAEELGRLRQSLEIDAETQEVGQRVGVVVGVIGHEVDDRGQWCVNLG